MMALVYFIVIFVLQEPHIINIMMARMCVRTVSSYVCTKGLCSFPVTVHGQSVNVFASVQQKFDVAILLSTRRNYKMTQKLSHLTVEEQFILRVSTELSVAI